MFFLQLFSRLLPVCPDALFEALGVFFTHVGVSWVCPPAPFEFPHASFGAIGSALRPTTHPFSRGHSSSQSRCCVCNFCFGTPGVLEDPLQLRFAKAPRIKKLSRSFFDLIVINTLLPIRYAYTRYLGGTGEEDLFRWVEKIPQEHNSITKLFDQLKVPIQHAGDSQGILHLFKNYCQKNQCISYNVGFHLMKL